MIVSLFINVARRIRAWSAARRKDKKALRMNTKSSVMFISSGNRKVFKFLN